MAYTLAATRFTSPNPTNTATGATVSTVNVGDLVVFLGWISGTYSHTGVSHPRCTAFQQVVGMATDVTTGFGGSMWWALATSTGTGTLQPTYSASHVAVPADDNCVCWNVYQFHTTSGSWSFDNGVSEIVTTASTTLTGATLTPTAGTTPSLYVGGMAGQTGTNGSTSGFTYGALDLYTDIVCYNLNVTAAVTPTATQTPSSRYNRFAGLFTTTTPSVTMEKTPPRNKARFRASFY